MSALERLHDAVADLRAEAIQISGSAPPYGIEFAVAGSTHGFVVRAAGVEVARGWGDSIEAAARRCWVALIGWQEDMGPVISTRPPQMAKAVGA